MAESSHVTRRSLLKAACAVPFAAKMTDAFAQSDKPLLTREIPHSGEKLPAVGLGTAVSFPAADQRQVAALSDVVDALLAGGGKLVDTASTYGNAENVIGEIVSRTKARERLFLATKIEVRSAKDGADEFKRSLQRLRTPRVDLLQLHNVSRANQSLAQLRDWKSAGQCRYIGVTSTFQDDYAAMEAIIRREKPDFVQVDYSMDNREAEKRIIPVAAEVGAAVLTALPLGRTSLFRAVKGKALPPWAKDFDAETWAQFFLKFLLGNPHVTAVIPGTGNAQHMRDNVGAARGRVPDEPQRQKMLALLNS
ncbi:MAG TPA: aldo/keto reductase [Xanthobacteraceae bacterium]|jgi:aryl-alcohol dehydrogenase-like predicted oxidoreductase